MTKLHEGWRVVGAGALITWMYLGSLAVGLGAGAVALALPRVRAPAALATA